MYLTPACIISLSFFAYPTCILEVPSNSHEILEFSIHSNLHLMITYLKLDLT